ncbi:MAG: hypothetical protein ACJ8AI_03845 [Rhodopila sp.]
MPKFIETKEGWINLDHVHWIRAVHTREDQTCRYILHTGNENFVKTSFKPIDWDIEAADIIPAAAGTVAYIFGAADEKRPTLNDIWVTVERVIGWRTTVSWWHADPVFAEHPSDGVVMLVMPNGQISWQEHGFYKDLARIMHGPRKMDEKPIYSMR